MERSLQIHKLVPVIIEPDQIGLDIEAALTESDEGVDFAIPNVTFEIYIGVRKVYEEKSDAATGQFVAKNVDIGQVESEFEVLISTTDQVGKLNIRISLDVQNVMKQIEQNRRKIPIRKEDDEKGEPDRITTQISPEEAEKERHLKESIRKALDQLLSRKYFEQKYDDDVVFFDIEKGSWFNSTKNSGQCHTSWQMNVDALRIPDMVGEYFEILVKNDSHPLVRREIVGVAEQHPYPFIKYSNLYYEATWAEAVISELIKKAPKEILEKLKEFYKYPWAKNIVAQIARCYPHVALSNIELYEYQPWAEEVTMIAAGLKPAYVIRYYDKYKDQPWADRVLMFAKQKNEDNKLAAEKSRQEAERAAAEQKLARKSALREEAERKKKSDIDSAIAVFSLNPSDQDAEKALRVFLKYQVDERAANAVKSLVKLNARFFFTFRDLYVAAPWGKEVTEGLIKWHPYAKYYLLLERSYGNGLTCEALESSLNYVIANHGKIADEILDIVLVCFEKSRNLEWAKSIAVKIAEHYPLLVIEKFDIFRFKPWTTDVLRIAAPKLTGISRDINFLRKINGIYVDYKQESWARILLADVAEKLKPLELQEEERHWLERAKQHRMNTARDVLANHIDKPWAEIVLRETCKHDSPVSQIVYDALDGYATKCWGKSFLLHIISLFPYMVLFKWPANTYGWDDEIIDVASNFYIRIFQQVHSSSSNVLISFCLQNPKSVQAQKFIARLSVTNPQFAKHLRKPKLFGFF